MPDLGQWLRDCPEQAMAQLLPDQVRPVAPAMLGFVLGPVLERVGGWIRSVGSSTGSVLLLLSLFPLGGDSAILARGRRG